MTGWRKVGALIGPRGARGYPGRDGAGVLVVGEVATVAELPATGQTGEAYVIDGDVHAWVGGAWQIVGTVNGFTGGSYNPATGAATFEGTGGIGFSTGDLRGGVGPQGPQGPQGPASTVPGPKGDQGDPGPKGDKGDAGSSAYQVAVAGGFAGTEAQWLASLVGPQGETGAGLTVLGSLATSAELPATGTPGDGYFIDGDLWVWTGAAWENVGNVQGPPGADGSPDTAAQVLAKLITVDGSGSGLDADLVRGTTPSAFGLSLLGNASASAARTTLGLGALATLSSVANDHVTNARLANMAAATIKGNNAGTTGDPMDLTVAQVKTMMALAIADVAGLQAALDAKLSLAGGTMTGPLTLAEVQETQSSLGTALTPDNGTVQIKTLTAALTLTEGAWNDGQAVVVTYSGANTHAITHPAAWKASDGFPATLKAVQEIVYRKVGGVIRYSPGAGWAS